MRLTERVLQLGSDHACAVRERAQRLESQGWPVLHLEAGEPDVATPPHIVEAGVRAMRDGGARYAPAAGLPALRGAIAQFVRGRGVVAESDNVVVTSGAKPMLFYALAALAEAGDEVLIPDPGYPVFESVVCHLLAKPVRYRVDPAREPAVDVEEIDALISPRTRVLVLNSPHNPTGAMLSSAELAAIADLVERHDLAVVSDEIYSQLVFEGEHRSIAAFPGMAERTVLVDGFSKAYAMAGWRLGYGVMPVPMARIVERFIISTTRCVPSFVQHAGIAALTGPQGGMAGGLRAGRELLTARLNALDGVSCSVPRGTFFAFPRITPVLRRMGVSADQFATALLEMFAVASLPGTAFGPGGAEHVRLSFATTQATLERAIGLIEEAIWMPREEVAVL